MLEKGKSFSDALSEAQEKGYAERNPSSDVDGIDASRKIAILMALVSDLMVDEEHMHKEGISAIDGKDVLYAEALSGAIKLVGYGYLKDGRIYEAVAPSIVKKDNPLYAVNGVFNGICAKGNAVGDVMFYGRGAGKLPTASAVVADICDIAKDAGNKNYFWADADEKKIIPYSEARESYLVRVRAESADEAEKLFNAEMITVCDGEAAFVSPYMPNGELEKMLSSLNVIKKIRIHGGEDR